MTHTVLDYSTLGQCCLLLSALCYYSVVFCVYLGKLRPLPANWHQTVRVGPRRCGGSAPGHSNHLWLSIATCCRTLVAIFMPYNWCLSNKIKTMFRIVLKMLGWIQR